MRNHMRNVLKYAGGICRVSYLETFCEEKNPGKLQEINNKGVAATPWLEAG